MQRRHEKIYSPAIGREINVLAYGHFGAPIIAFPSGGGQFHDFEDNGMVEALAPLIYDGKIKLYCTESLDNESWLLEEADPHHRGMRHNAYQDFILSNLIPAIRYDCHNAHVRIALTGCSLGAYHAANFTLKFPHIFHYALCLSGRYNIESVTGPTGSEDVYFNNPLAYLPNLYGDALDHVRHNAHISLVCGQGAWEEKCLLDTHRLADLLVEKGISHERDIWGQDVEHHWHWWRQQIMHHLSKTFD